MIVHDSAPHRGSSTPDRLGNSRLRPEAQPASPCSLPVEPTGEGSGASRGVPDRARPVHTPLRNREPDAGRGSPGCNQGRESMSPIDLAVRLSDCQHASFPHQRDSVQEHSGRFPAQGCDRGTSRSAAAVHGLPVVHRGRRVQGQRVAASLEGPLVAGAYRAEAGSTGGGHVLDVESGSTDTRRRQLSPRRP
jgi:hypothetical protein